MQLMSETHLSLLYPTGWQDYELLDSGDGEKLEKFGAFTLIRPDPQILWAKSLPNEVWQRADAVFHRAHADKGTWKMKQLLPDEWPMIWEDMTALAKLSPFKHTGIFPEQSAHWMWMRQALNTVQSQKPSQPPHVLNLFAYTGMASLVCAKAGAKVTHVDASRSAIGWAKKNQQASSLDPQSVRWILDDVVKFVGREIKRGVKYDAIIMDPPVYGHGPQGERWEFKESLPILLEMCQELLSNRPLFVLINAYAVSTSAITLGNILGQVMTGFDGTMEVGELALKEEPSGRSLSTGIFARWGSNSV
jgi:23S rRNA (cytosine1962-C5)-methyltransferase